MSYYSLNRQDRGPGKRKKERLGIQLTEEGGRNMEEKRDRENTENLLGHLLREKKKKTTQQGNHNNNQHVTVNNKH